MDLLGISDEVLIARGRYATLRSAHRKHAHDLQIAVVASTEQCRLLLRFVDDVNNMTATHHALRLRMEQIDEHCAYLLDLTEELNALRETAWGKGKHDGE